MPQLSLAAQPILQEWEPAKITDNLAQPIDSLLKRGLSRPEIGKIFGVRPACAMNGARGS